MNNNKREQWTAELTAKLLDAALGQYRSVEPRAGLEERILTNLQIKRQTARWFWWQWGPGLASAAVIVTLFVALSLSRQLPRSDSKTLPGTVTGSHTEPAHAASSSTVAPQHAQPTATGTAVPPVIRKMRMVREFVAPPLVAQQTRPSQASELRIEDVKIPAVAVAEIVMR